MAEICYPENRRDVIFLPWMKFGRLAHNDMPTAVVRSNAKPEVEFQYGGRLFFQTGNSYISVVD